MLRWFEEAGVRNDIVISSKVRLARNINAYPFSTCITEKQIEKMLSDTGKVVLKLPATAQYRDYILEDLDDIQKEALVERNVISNYLSNQKEAMFFVSEDEKNTIMLNEEDHIRIQCTEAGLNLKGAFERVNQLDDMIGSKIEYAYDDNFGYLTTCPSNVGTGMKASLMMHLPALGNSKKIQDLISEVGHFGVDMKGLYGEDGSGSGHIYQISNQKTLGFSEEEIINNLESIAKQIIDREKECQRQVLKSDKSKLEDEIYKSYGILKYSRRLNFKDAMLFLSEIRLGLSLHIIEFQDNSDFMIYQLIIGSQPANLKLIAQRDMDDGELEELRARFIRENLPLIN